MRRRRRHRRSNSRRPREHPAWGAKVESYIHTASTHSTEKQKHCVTFAVSMDDGQITHLPSDRLLWILFTSLPPMSVNFIL